MERVSLQHFTESSGSEIIIINNMNCISSNVFPLDGYNSVTTFGN